ncbi:MAG: peptidase, partial [Pseudomonadota bacterium]
MTYCIAACVDAGLVFVADSRTNAGIDRLGTHSKLHAFTQLPGRFFTLLSAGNLATTQAVIARLERDLRENAPTSLATVGRMREAADYVGEVNRTMADKYGDEKQEGVSFGAEFIFGGRIGASEHALFLIYAQGNYISPPPVAPFLQIGELKYGRPILDRIIRRETSLETAALCGLVSMDSTMRSN